MDPVRLPGNLGGIPRARPGIAGSGAAPGVRWAGCRAGEIQGPPGVLSEKLYRAARLAGSGDADSPLGRPRVPCLCWGARYHLFEVYCEGVASLRARDVSGVAARELHPLERCSPGNHPTAPGRFVVRCVSVPEMAGANGVEVGGDPESSFESSFPWGCRAG
jgi:hypothetical protein